MEPRICCLDLDCFFVSVERLLDPSLEGKPVVVGALPGNRGVVTACSYEVRRLGVHSGMPISSAVKLAPHSIYLPGRFQTYSPYSRQVREVVERFTPSVQAASIDEFYLDFRGCERVYRRRGDPDDDATVERAVGEMRAVIRAEVGLPASAGIGASRTIAKVASGRAKPDGTLMIREGGEEAFLGPLPVRKLPGIGPVTERKLLEDGIRFLGQLLELPPGQLRDRWGELADRIRDCCHPGDEPRLGGDRPAFQEHDPHGLTGGSISNERTFHADVEDEQTIQAQLLKLSERVCHRIRTRGIRARTVTLKLRYADFQTLTRSKTVPPTDLEDMVYGVVTALYAEGRTRRTAIRLLGVGLSNLVGPGAQLSLPFEEHRRPPTSVALDAVRRRFGYEAIHLGHGPGSDRWLV